MSEIFEACARINNHLLSGEESAARNLLIQLLHQRGADLDGYGSLVNTLIRQTGLYPYMILEQADWPERYIYDAFRVQIGAGMSATLHREQSALLRRLIDGEDLAISAPTSFGKSFVIDAFIELSKPINVVIIVPTLALTDETRRRLHRKFAPRYKVITTTNVELSDRNILVFPQERVQAYVDRLEEIDLLVIDEFYKASIAFDKERAPALLSAILRMQDRAKQRYFLAPNITALSESPFTRGMTFERLDFSTVYLEQHHCYLDIRRDAVKKSRMLIDILSAQQGKSLIYAGSYSNIDRVGALIVDKMPPLESRLLWSFSSWLAKHYDPNWTLVALVTRGAGVHNGQIHRSLSQIQIKLFEEEEGLGILISTSSIVEGVNTSAQNVILWSNRKGRPRLDDFTYRNIMGRGGRMFRHFVGHLYILEEPPEPEVAQLDLQVPDQLLGEIDEERLRSSLTDEQVTRVIEFKSEMSNLLGVDVANRLAQSTALQTSNWSLIREIARDMRENAQAWSQLRTLTYDDPAYWDNVLYKVIRLQPAGWDIQYSKFVAFIKVLSRNWDSSIPELLDGLDSLDIGVEQFFKLERLATFRLAALLNDVYVVSRELRPDETPDISGFIGRLSSAFLPALVYQLEEYGLPRMLSRRIHYSGLVDLTNPDASLHEILAELMRVGVDGILHSGLDYDEFDEYVLRYFVEGITPATAVVNANLA
jgi:hypothetical protein